MKIFDLKIPLDLNWGGSSHLHKLLFFNHDIDTSLYLFNMIFFLEIGDCFILFNKFYAIMHFIV